jgi:hypothetical protein
MPNAPWTLAELETMLAANLARIRRAEADYPEARPVPPLAVAECRELLLALADRAQWDTLEDEEVFLCGQLVQQFEQAVRAETLGYKGRYYCMSEAQLEQLLQQEKSDGPPQPA